MNAHCAKVVARVRVPVGLAAPAEAGELVTTRAIQQAFEQHVGTSVHVSTIDKLLDRHDWRKACPRPRHPKADPAAQAQ
jgi:hypothetical protein